MGESSEHCWGRLSAEARATVVVLLARLIARGVIAEEASAGGVDE
jgi:hypothetical protein